MDPVSMMLGVSGLALQAYGASQKMAGASAAASAQKQQIGLEQQAEATRQQYMEYDSRQKSLQVARNMQRARHLALNNATTQGAQFGSGLQGGYGQVAGQGNTNLQGIGVNLGLGRQMFGINSQISQAKISQVTGQQQMQFGSGLQSLGSGLTGAMGPVRQMTGLTSDSWSMPNISGAGPFWMGPSGRFT